MVGYLKAKRVVVGAFVAAGAAVALGRRGVADPTGDYTEHGFVRRRISTPAGEMAYYEAGRGRPLVFLHGIGGGASAWTWSKVAPAFTANYRVIVPDWVGWGESEHPRRLLMFEDYVAQLETLLGHLGRPATVVTQSLATGFASELARKKPEAFDGMVMLTPSGGLDFGEDAFGPVARRTLTPLARTWPVTCCCTGSSSISGALYGGGSSPKASTSLGPLAARSWTPSCTLRASPAPRTRRCRF